MPPRERPTFTVLLIDHSASDRTYWARELRRCSAEASVDATSDYEIIEASDKQSGLALYRSQRRIDCVVLELSLPDHTGFMTLVELVPVARRPEIAVIALTRMTVRGVWELAKHNGAYVCLAKQHTTGEDLHRAIQLGIVFVSQLPKRIGITTGTLRCNVPLSVGSRYRSSGNQEGRALKGAR